METRDGVADVMEYYNGGNNHCNKFLQDWQVCPASNNIDNTTGNNVNYSNSNSTGNGNSNGYSNIVNNQAQQVAAQAEKPAVRIKVNGKKNFKAVQNQIQSSEQTDCCGRVKRGQTSSSECNGGVESPWSYNRRPYVQVTENHFYSLYVGSNTISIHNFISCIVIHITEGKKMLQFLYQMF